MWFQKELKDSINYMIEPDSFNMGQGKRNFELNNLKGSFIQAYIGKQSSQDGAVKTMCIDDFVKEHSIKFIHMLHSDIQGFEYDMLVGASRTFDLKQIGYVFVSTHSNDLHNQCLKFLIERKFIIIAEANLDESFSEDGLIAARAPHFDGVTKIEISKRSPK